MPDQKREAKVRQAGQSVYVVELPEGHTARPPDGGESLELEARDVRGGWLVRLRHAPARLTTLQAQLVRLAGALLVLAARMRRRGGSQAWKPPARSWDDQELHGGPGELQEPEDHPAKIDRARLGRHLRSVGAALLALLAWLGGILLPQDNGFRDAGVPEQPQEEEPIHVDRADEHLVPLLLAAPMPQKPLEGQARPPCRREEGEFERNGGCWLLLDKEVYRPPCPRGKFELEGRCWAVVGASRAQPRALDHDAGFALPAVNPRR